MTNIDIASLPSDKKGYEIALSAMKTQYERLKQMINDNELESVGHIKGYVQTNLDEINEVLGFDNE